MTAKQALNNAYAQGVKAERARWRPLYQMIHILEPELRVGSIETTDKARRAQDASQHDLVLKLLEVAPAWPAD